MRHPVAREVQNRAEKDGLGSRPSCGACHGASGHVQRDDHRDLPYAPAGRHDLVRTLQANKVSPAAVHALGHPRRERNVTASRPRSLLRVGPSPHPVADEIHRDCDPCKEERRDAPGSWVTAAMSARVREDAS